MGLDGLGWDRLGKALGSARLACKDRAFIYACPKDHVHVFSYKSISEFPNPFVDGNVLQTALPSDTFANISMKSICEIRGTRDIIRTQFANVSAAYCFALRNHVLLRGD